MTEQSNSNDIWTNPTTVDLKVSTLKEIKSTSPPSYAIEQWIVGGWLYLLSGFPGVGKSIFTMLLCKSFASGQDFLNTYKVNKTGPAIIVDQENPLTLLKDRIDKMRIDEDLPIYYVHFQSIRFDSSSYFESLLKAIEKYQPVFIVFDSLIRFHSGDENTASGMAPVMAKLREISNKGPAVMVIHHSPKNSGTQRNKPTLSRGSGDITGAIDVEYGMTRERGRIETKSYKTRVAPFDPINLELVSTDSYLDLIIAGSTSSQTFSDVRNGLRQFIESNGKPPNQKQFIKIVKRASEFTNLSTREAVKTIEDGTGRFWKKISGGKNNEKLYEAI